MISSFQSTLMKTSLFAVLQLYGYIGTATAAEDSHRQESPAIATPDTSPKEPRPESLPINQRRAFRSHISRAEKYRRDTHYSMAIEHYQAAYQIYRDPNLLYNIGRAYHHEGKWSDALNYYERYQREVPEVDPALKRSLNEYIRQLRLALLGAQTLQSADGTTPNSTDASVTGSALSNVNPPATVPSGIIFINQPKTPADSSNKTPIHKRRLFWGLLGGGVGAALVAGVVGGVVANSGPKLPGGAPIRPLTPSLLTIGGTLP